jgi:hypothetical protein
MLQQVSYVSGLPNNFTAVSCPCEWHHVGMFPKLQLVLSTTRQETHFVQKSHSPQTLLIKKLNSYNKDFGADDKENRRFQDKDTHLNICSS